MVHRFSLVPTGTLILFATVIDYSPPPHPHLWRVVAGPPCGRVAGPTFGPPGSAGCPALRWWRTGGRENDGGPGVEAAPPPGSSCRRRPERPGFRCRSPRLGRGGGGGGEGDGEGHLVDTEVSFV